MLRSMVAMGAVAYLLRSRRLPLPLALWLSGCVCVSSSVPPSARPSVRPPIPPLCSFSLPLPPIVCLCLCLLLLCLLSVFANRRAALSLGPAPERAWLRAWLQRCLSSLSLSRARHLVCQ